MKRFAIVFTLASLAFAAQPAAAQSEFNPQEDFRWVGASGVNSSWTPTVQVGPYRGTLGADPGGPALTLYCVDFAYSIAIADNPITANTTRLDADQSVFDGNTRLGLASASNVVERYQQAAYLSAMFSSTAQTSWSALHAAIWSIMSPGSFTQNPTGMSDYVNMAGAAAQAGFVGFDFTEWYVFSDVEILADGTGGVQEFLVRVPEPSTILLLLAGMPVFIGVRRRRIAEL